jgi:hypothetical protein
LTKKNAVTTPMAAAAATAARTAAAIAIVVVHLLDCFARTWSGCLLSGKLL